MKRVIIASRSDSNERLCRIATVGEFDNGRVLRRYTKMTPSEAENAAREASIDDPNHIYYVHYDDIMNPSSEWRYIDGEKYHYSEVEYINGQIVLDN